MDSQPYEAQRVSREQRKSPEYLKINPAGAVPALQDGDWVLTQNAAILITSPTVSRGARRRRLTQGARK